MFAGTVPGYSQPDAIDPTGYSLRDLELPGRIVDGMIPDDVMAPLGPVAMGGDGSAQDSRFGDPEADTKGAVVVGRVAPSSYGSWYSPKPGGALADESRVYGPSFGEIPSGGYLAPGSVARLEDLGMNATGLGPRTAGEFVGGHHAQGAAPLEYTGQVSPEHVQSTIESGVNVYGGYQGILNPGERGGPGAYGGIYDGRSDPTMAPMSPSGKGGAFGPDAFSAVGKPLFREVDPGASYDVGVDPGEDAGWRRPNRTRAAGPYDMSSGAYSAYDADR